MTTRSIRLSVWCWRAVAALAVVFVALTASMAARQGTTPPQHPATGAHHHPEAAKLKNPVPANASSLAAGAKLYAKQCASCHGDTGKGDGMMGEDMDPKPANLVDPDWKHGSSDGEIFVVIRDGVKRTGMKPFAKKMTARQIWDVINYIRSIGHSGTH